MKITISGKSKEIARVMKHRQKKKKIKINSDEFTKAVVSAIRDNV